MPLAYKNNENKKHSPLERESNGKRLVQKNFLKRKQKAYRFGHLAEAAVALYFLLQGYRILAMRWRSPAGEIDMLAARGKQLVAIEVKARATLGHCEHLTVKQQARIRDAMRLWLARHPEHQEKDVRFDLFLLSWRKFQHLRDAW